VSSSSSSSSRPNHFSKLLYQQVEAGHTQPAAPSPEQPV
jgi:hypothetical protein